MTTEPASTALTTARVTVFLTELHGFFDSCDEQVDAALARHFGFDTAVDWITASLELVTEHLQHFGPHELHGDTHD
ncbi:MULTISPECIES: hypothetical protein [Streptomyces]|uniref:hypothetical protein n=1 Tax=Streptomyces TaxID=1883 RepID=UPI00141384D7|nr:hypothetical protein [Streptomyces sp. VN1]QIP74704.1 hypothetical protein EZV63_36730 [Streptomyces sp. VN1]